MSVRPSHMHNRALSCASFSSSGSEQSELAADRSSERETSLSSPMTSAIPSGAYRTRAQRECTRRRQ
ncbi:unnamed protein product [Mycena citricolor]|uniref:Uncharacterized protein n=1 Tax=Mycena citricolor TaxID=2018698 RepID=A0AAD2H415_9AGAR|nr:unnamed protein product [Mycena citricolor]